MVSVIFVFFLVDLFDSTGTLVGVSHRAGLLVDGKLPRLKRALLADSTAIVAGAALVLLQPRLMWKARRAYRQADGPLRRRLPSAY